MEYLFYDLIEEIVGYLPYSDVETIAKVTTRSPGLENWNIKAKDQLENRFFLDVNVNVGQTDKEGGGPRTTLRCSAVRNPGICEFRKEWDFTKWRYAWIRSLHIQTRKGHKYIEQAAMDEVLCVVSLPVEPSVQASLTLEHNYDRHGHGIDRVMDRFRKILQATQKEFVRVQLDHAEHDPPGVVEEFVADFIKRGVFLKELGCRKIDTLLHQGSANAILQFDGQKRDLDFLKPWNLRVDFQWVESAINSWCHFTGIDDWLKRVVEYGPEVDRDIRSSREHPSRIVSLEEAQRDELAL